MPKYKVTTEWTGYSVVTVSLWWLLVVVTG
jgi:hypothetical protein